MTPMMMMHDNNNNDTTAWLHMLSKQHGKIIQKGSGIPHVPPCDKGSLMYGDNTYL